MKSAVLIVVLVFAMMLTVISVSAATPQEWRVVLSVDVAEAYWGASDGLDGSILRTSGCLGIGDQAQFYSLIEPGMLAPHQTTAWVWKPASMLRWTTEIWKDSEHCFRPGIAPVQLNMVIFTPGGNQLANLYLTEMPEGNISISTNAVNYNEGYRVVFSSNQPVPEPSSLFALCSGIATLGFLRRKRG